MACFQSLVIRSVHIRNQLFFGTISLDKRSLQVQCEHMENEKQLRVALYARVSTRDKGQNPELQLSELRRFADLRGWQIIGEFVDVGISGSKDSRPQLDAMMRLAKARKLDVIAVWNLDRFGCSLTHFVNRSQSCRQSV